MWFYRKLGFTAGSKQRNNMRLRLALSHYTHYKIRL